MAEQASTLYGSTSKTGSVPNAPTASNAGPAYSEDGRLILDASFTDLSPVPNMTRFEADLASMIGGDDFVETWRIWDCCAQAWAGVGLELHRFEMFDLVVRRQGNSVCTWRGAIDTCGRVLASPNAEKNEAKCWQWLRENN